MPNNRRQLGSTVVRGNTHRVLFLFFGFNAVFIFIAILGWSWSVQLESLSKYRNLSKSSDEYNTDQVVRPATLEDNSNATAVFDDDFSITPKLCEKLPVSSVDTILWGAGEGDQVHDIIGAFFIARRLGITFIEQDFRKSFSGDSDGIWKGVALSQLLNYSHPIVNQQLFHLECSSCPSSLWEEDIRNTCMCRSRYMRGGVKSLFQSCDKSHLQFAGDGFNISDYQNIQQNNQSLFLRKFDPCGLQRGALFCPWLKGDLRDVGPNFFVSSYPGLKQFDGSNSTCVHLRINDKYMTQVADGLNISAMKAVEVLDEDNFGCCYHTLKEGKCTWEGHIQTISFMDYVRRIFSVTAESSAPNLYIMAPPGVSTFVKPLAEQYGVNANFLEDYIDETFQGQPTHADKILCASSSIFAGTKSSFSNTVKMMRGFQRWVWLHQYYNMTAVSEEADRELYHVEDWERIPEG